MNDILDIHYIDKVLEGDKDAFRYFIKEYQHMGYSIAISIVKIKQDSEDVVQNAFVQAYKNLRSFKKDSKFSSWLYKIVVNEALKHISKNKKKATYHSVEIEETNDSCAENDAIEKIEKSEKQKTIHEVLYRMKPKEALVLKMHYLHELSLKEIEESTGFSVNNIKVLLFRARKSFKQISTIHNNTI